MRLILTIYFFVFVLQCVNTRAQCSPPVLRSGPQDMIVSGCPDISKKSKWYLDDGPLPATLESRGLGQCSGPPTFFGSWETEC